MWFWSKAFPKTQPLARGPWKPIRNLPIAQNKTLRLNEKVAAGPRSFQNGALAEATKFKLDAYLSAQLWNLSETFSDNIKA